MSQKTPTAPGREVDLPERRSRPSICLSPPRLIAFWEGRRLIGTPGQEESKGALVRTHLHRQVGAPARSCKLAWPALKTPPRPPVPKGRLPLPASSLPTSILPSWLPTSSSWDFRLFSAMV
jgi:hypothetical protein